MTIGIWSNQCAFFIAWKFAFTNAYSALIPTSPIIFENGFVRVMRFGLRRFIALTPMIKLAR